MAKDFIFPLFDTDMAPTSLPKPKVIGFINLDEALSTKRNPIIKEGHNKGLRYVNDEVGYVDEDEEYY